MDYGKVSGLGRVGICASAGEVYKALMENRSISAVPPAPQCDTPSIRKKAAEADRHLSSLNSFWSKTMNDRDITYARPIFRLSTDGVTTCGPSVPGDLMKYCPIDHTIYRGVQQYGVIAKATGVSGEAADAVALAHEMGHHIQKLDGTLAKASWPIYIAQQSPNPTPAAKARATRATKVLETQADCYAGHWVRNEYFAGRFTIKDVDDARRFVSGLGDDHLAALNGNNLSDIESTHGTSMERVTAFLTGLGAKQVESCVLPKEFRF